MDGLKRITSELQAAAAAGWGLPQPPTPSHHLYQPLPPLFKTCSHGWIIYTFTPHFTLKQDFYLSLPIGFFQSQSDSTGIVVHCPSVSP